MRHNRMAYCVSLSHFNTLPGVKQRVKVKELTHEAQIIIHVDIINLFSFFDVQSTKACHYLVKCTLETLLSHLRVRQLQSVMLSCLVLSWPTIKKLILE